MKFKIMLPLMLMLSGCAVLQKNSIAREKWYAVLNSNEFQEEKKIYTKRMNGNLCITAGVSSFLNSQAGTPEKECLYLSSRLIVDDDRKLRQAIQQLKVLQIVPDGFVVKSPNYRDDQIIFIHKTDEEGVVDGAFLDLKNGGEVYRYAGLYKYQSLVGSKTVFSFRKIPTAELLKAKEDLKVYAPMKEVFIRNEFWGELEGKGG